jgi:hypothetical protein
VKINAVKAAGRRRTKEGGIRLADKPRAAGQGNISQLKKGNEGSVKRETNNKHFTYIIRGRSRVVSVAAALQAPGPRGV